MRHVTAGFFDVKHTVTLTGVLLTAAVVLVWSPGCPVTPRLMADRYETPPASELQRLLWVKAGTSGHLDEVRPGIYIGDM